MHNPKITIPPVTPEFVAQLRETARTAPDSLGKRFLDKLFAYGDKDNKTPGENRGDKLALSFLTRLQNAMTKNRPVRTILWGYEKRLLDEACREYTASEIKRLEAKEEHGTLEPFEEMALNLIGMDRVPLEYQRQYNRRKFLGVGLQALAVPMTPLMMWSFWEEDEAERKKQIAKHGPKGERSDVYNFYCKAGSQIKGLGLGLCMLLVGDAIKEIGPRPSVVWDSKSDSMVDDLSQILAGMQAGMDKDRAKEEGRG